MQLHLSSDLQNEISVKTAATGEQSELWRSCGNSSLFVVGGSECRNPDKGGLKVTQWRELVPRGIAKTANR
jgi:hypothetical protein